MVIHLAGASLPTGKITLIGNAHKLGAKDLRLISGMIKEKDSTQYLVFSAESGLHLGQAELIPNEDKTEFFAFFGPRQIQQQGNTHEVFSATIAHLYITAEGQIYCSLTTPQFIQATFTQYLVRKGHLE